MGIETGRHKKLSFEEGVCKKYNNNAVKDEIHFLYECPMYDSVESTQLTPEISGMEPWKSIVLLLFRQKSPAWISYGLHQGMYDDLRKNYFNFDFTNPPIDRTELLKQVLTDDSAENTRVLGKFLKEAFFRH